MLIQSIDSRAKAYGKGLEVRDIITGINGKEITTMNEINEVKNQFQGGRHRHADRSTACLPADARYQGRADRRARAGRHRPAKIRIDEAKSRRTTPATGTAIIPSPSAIFGW